MESIINRNKRMTLAELQELIRDSAEKGYGTYKVVIHNTDKFCKWGADNKEETLIVIHEENHQTMGDITLFDAYVGNTFIKGSIEYYDCGDIGVFPQINNINPFKVSIP